jgi:hypothetical protein
VIGASPASPTGGPRARSGPKLGRCGSRPFGWVVLDDGIGSWEKESFGSVIAPPHPAGRGSTLTLDSEDDRLADGLSRVVAPDDEPSRKAFALQAAAGDKVPRPDWPHLKSGHKSGQGGRAEGSIGRPCRVPAAQDRSHYAAPGRWPMVPHFSGRWLGRVTVQVEVDTPPHDERFLSCHLWLCRGKTTSCRSSWIVAAIGTAISAPMMPRSEPPINVATMVNPGVTLTVCFMTRGFRR